MVQLSNKNRKGIRIPGNREIFVRRIMNPGLWNPEYSSRNPESGIILTIEIQNQVPLTKTGIQYLESGIHGVEYRIQDCLGYPCTGRY